MKKCNPYEKFWCAVFLELKTSFFNCLIFTLFSVILLVPFDGPKLDYLLNNVVTESLGLESFMLTFWLSAFVIGLAYFLFGPFVGGAEGEEGILSHQLSQYWEGKKPKRCLKMNYRVYKYVVLPINNFNISFGVGSAGILLGFYIVDGFRVGFLDKPLAFLLGFLMVLILTVMAQMFKYFWLGAESIHRCLARADDKTYSDGGYKVLRGLSFLVAMVAFCYGYNKLSTELDRVSETSMQVETEHGKSDPTKVEKEPESN